MKTIIYTCGEPNTLSGGFGDRIVGMISTLYLCDKYKCNFLIRWCDTNLEEYFDYPNYTNSKLEGKFDTYRNHSKVDFVNNFNCDHLFFNTNQNIIPLNKKNYEEYILELYNKLFTKYLIAKENILLFKEEFDIGIQIRTGDYFMNKSLKQIGKPDILKPFSDNIIFIKNYIDNLLKNNLEKNIFITSDINIDKLIDLNTCKNVKCYNITPVHIERSIDKKGIEKTYIDFITLSKCKELYITKDSNFGRCASLINYNNKVKGLKFNNKKVSDFSGSSEGRANNIEVFDFNIKTLSCKTL